MSDQPAKTVTTAYLVESDGEFWAWVHKHTQETSAGGFSPRHDRITKPESYPALIDQDIDVRDNGGAGYEFRLTISYPGDTEVVHENYSAAEQALALRWAAGEKIA